MTSFFGTSSILVLLLFAQLSWDMDAVPVFTASQAQEDKATVEVRDRGEVFGPEAERRAREVLQGVHNRHRVAIRVETVRSLDGAWIADVAQRRARTAGANRLYILIAGEDRDVGVIGARHGAASRLSDQQRETIRRAFLGPLREGNPDEAIAHGVRAIGATLDAAARPASGVHKGLIVAATLLAVLAALFASRAWARSRCRDRQRRTVSAWADLSEGRRVVLRNPHGDSTPRQRAFTETLSSTQSCEQREA